MTNSSFPSLHCILMFSEVYSQPLAKPTEAALNCFEFRSHREILCADYEPRFSLTALGTSDGHLIVMNNNFDSIESENGVDAPIVTILSCVNTSSFLTVSSRALCLSSANQFVPKELLPEFFQQSQSISEEESIVAHWMIKPNAIVCRRVLVKGNISTVALSPSHANFALLGMVTGSIAGFSIEDMELTSLYIDMYEKRGLSHIVIHRGLRCYVCSDNVERVDLSLMECEVCTSKKVMSADVVESSSAAITPLGEAVFMSDWRQKAVVHKPQDCTCVYAAVLSKNKWIAVFRSGIGDVVFINGNEVLKLDFDYLLFNFLGEYEEPFSRTGMKSLRFITVKGRVVDLTNETAEMSSLYLPHMGDFHGIRYGLKQFIFWEKVEEKVVYYVIENGCLVKQWETNSEPPFSHKGTSFFALKNGDILVCNPIEQTQDCFLSLPSPVVKIQTSLSFVDLVLEDGMQWSCNLTQDGWLFTLMEFAVPSSALAWKRVGMADGSMRMAFIDDTGHLVLNGRSVHILDRKERLVAFHVLDSFGLLSDNGAFLLVVTNERVRLFEPNSLKNVAQHKLKEIIDVGFTGFCSLAVHLPQEIVLLALPDVQKRLGNIPLAKNAQVVMIDPGCIAVAEPPETRIYSCSPAIQLYDPGKPQIPEPPEVVRSFLVQREIPKANIEQADKSFGYRTARHSLSSLSNTTDVMQQLLTVAQERSEKLREMEVKAERLRESARRFAQLAHKLPK